MLGVLVYSSSRYLGNGSEDYVEKIGMLFSDAFQQVDPLRKERIKTPPSSRPVTTLKLRCGRRNCQDHDEEKACSGRGSKYLEAFRQHIDTTRSESKGIATNIRVSNF